MPRGDARCSPGAGAGGEPPFNLGKQAQGREKRSYYSLPGQQGCAPRVWCSHDHRQRGQSIPRQAQPGALGSDSGSQVAAAVSQGSPPRTAAVLWLTGPSVSPAGTVTMLAPSQPWHWGEQPENGALLCGVFPASFQLSSPRLTLLYLCLCRVHRLLLYFQQ